MLNYNFTTQMLMLKLILNFFISLGYVNFFIFYFIEIPLLHQLQSNLQNYYLIFASFKALNFQIQTTDNIVQLNLQFFSSDLSFYLLILLRWLRMPETYYLMHFYNYGLPYIRRLFQYSKQHCAILFGCLSNIYNLFLQAGRLKKQKQIKLQKQGCLHTQTVFILLFLNMFSKQSIDLMTANMIYLIIYHLKNFNNFIYIFLTILSIGLQLFNL
ncbi:unnamed protein product [Paramecium sonneborni]|uniref:Transmembrane protein n=1 Tax=Paramecium sonneborni TaxID=65129 RepID=A0A8S1RLP6_9CILI|nr:unnamed protein product [Paramecium sonneborni]